MNAARNYRWEVLIKQKVKSCHFSAFVVDDRGEFIIGSPSLLGGADAWEKAWVIGGAGPLETRSKEQSSNEQRAFSPSKVSTIAIAFDGTRLCGSDMLHSSMYSPQLRLQLGALRR